MAKKHIIIVITMEGKAGLWIPHREMTLHAEFPVPSPETLQEAWAEYSPGEVVEPSDVYGCLTLPAQPPTGYLSVDLCEVLRETHESVRTLQDPFEKIAIKSIHDYCIDLPIEGPHDIISMVQVMMNHNLVRPVNDITEIGSILRSLKTQGVYIFANTSTLPGCELGTIDFLKTYLPEVIDGIVFPRNHNGDLAFTKGHAARNVIEQISEGHVPLFAFHIDDAPYHNVAFREHVQKISGLRVATFQPHYPSFRQPDPLGTVAPSPLKAFELIQKQIREITDQTS